MALAPQTIALLKTARSLATSLPADGILLLAEGDIAFDEARKLLGSCKLMVAFTTDAPHERPEGDSNLIVLDIEGGPTPIQERMSLALLEAVRLEHLHPGADVVVLYNGIQVGVEGQGESTASASSTSANTWNASRPRNCATSAPRCRWPRFAPWSTSPCRSAGKDAKDNPPARFWWWETPARCFPIAAR